MNPLREAGNYATLFDVRIKDAAAVGVNDAQRKKAGPDLVAAVNA